MLLRSEGFKVLAVPDNAQAKAQLSKRAPDLMLCELVAPDGSTLGLLRSIKQDKRLAKMRICVLTNIAAKTPLTQAVEAGVNALMLKSRFNFKGLVRQLTELYEKGSEKDGSEKPAEEAKRYPLPLPAPDPMLELRQHKPVITRPELEKALEEYPRIQCSEQAVAHVRSILESDQCEMESLANALQGDPGLMSRLFREANSNDDACEEPANNVFEALLRVGLDRLIAILDSLPEDESISKASPDGFVTTDQLRAHCLAVGVIASKIASHCQGIDQRWAMTCGLLHDVGRTRLLGALGSKFTEIADASSSLGVPLHAGEKRMLLMEHDKLGMTMSNAWNLPREVSQVIGYHHEEHPKLGTVCSAAPKLAACVALADQIAHALGYGHSGSTTIEPCETLFEMLENDELTMETITDGLREQIDQGFKQSGVSQDLLSDGVHHPVPDQTLHPVFISANPETDIYGQWLRESFGELAEDQTPNIAIVHLRQTKDRNDLSDALASLQERLSEQGAHEPIPVLILSPTGRYGLTEEVLTRHPSMHLRTPFAVSMFERSVNALFNGQQQLEAVSTTRMAA
jgi:putative nucleotidyltransferase with HDIG domain